MNYTICSEFPNQMLLKTEGPCLSIYMPTHRFIMDKKQDVLIFKRLVKEAKESLEKKYSNRDIKELMSLLELMEIDHNLWNYSLDGLVIFASLSEMIIYRVEKTLKEIAIVSNSFHIKPLFEYFQVTEIFTILAFDTESFAIYEGNNLDIKNIVLNKEVKTTINELLEGLHNGKFQTHGVYGGGFDNFTAHGHGGKTEEEEIDRIKFFKYVDRYVFYEISKKIEHPLILVANKEHQFEFRKLSINPFLIEESIDGIYSDFLEQDLKKELENIMNIRFNAFIDKAIEKYNNFNNDDMSSDQLIIVLRALLESRVDILFIEEDKIIPGKIDIKNKQIISSDLDNPDTDDLLDDMIQQALKTGTKVYILNKDKMPTLSGVAAILRY